MSAPPLKWLCLDAAFFDGAKTKVIRAMPEGDKLLLAWIGLLCLAAKMGGTGMIVLARNIPLSPDTLAVLLGESPNVVRLALETFERLGMVEIVDADALRIVGWAEHQHHAGLERSRERQRLRQANFRERRKLPPAGPANPPVAEAPRRDAFADLDPELAAKWRPAYEALTSTGKLPALTVEHLVIVAREYPRARLAQQFGEVVAEAQGVVGCVSSSLAWLRKVVGKMELRAAGDGQGGSSGPAYRTRAQRLAAGEDLDTGMNVERRARAMQGPPAGEM